ncbi:MAG: DNA topoisomerase IB [Sphingomonadaceae bacterium]
MATQIELFPAPCTYIDDFTGGYTRAVDGDGFRFLTSSGKPVRAQKTLARLQAIGLPPAYDRAWYCASPRGHIQATGMDAAGRRQYRYHPAFRAEAEQEKFASLAAFGAALPRIRERVSTDLARRDLSRERVVAAVVRLLDTGHIRIGNRQYAAANNSFGATTLRNRHARVGRDTLRLEFIGKSGKAHSITIADRRLASVVRQCQDLPGQQLFQFVDADGARHEVTSGDVNDWLRICCGAFTAKMFRTWHASVIAFGALVESGGEVKMRPVMDLVASQLGNTPAVARKSYVHPALLDVLTGERIWQKEWAKLPRAAKRMEPVERGFLNFLGSAA